MHNLPNSARFPKYSYNTLSSSLKIQSHSSALHEQAISTISKGFILAADRLAPELGQRTSVSTNELYTGFVNQYKGSDKTPDMAFETWGSTGPSRIKFVLEVGLAETYEMLVEDTKMWLEGTKDVSAVMVVKLQENPNYRCPTRNLKNKDFAAQGFLESGEIGLDDFILEATYGPAIYNQCIWVGRISGFIEIWKRDLVSGCAIRKGDSIVSEQLTEI